MKTKIFKMAALIALTVMSTACANQWREADDSISEDDAFSFVNELSPQLSALSGIEENQSSVVYFAQSGEASGVAESVMSFGDLGFLDSSLNGATVFDVLMDSVSVALVDAYTGDQRVFALLIKAQINGQTVTFVKESSDYSFTKNKFEVIFVGNNGEPMLLRSYDVDKTHSDELGGTIHLKAYNISGEEIQIGQFSSLRGFGG